MASLTPSYRLLFTLLWKVQLRRHSNIGSLLDGYVICSTLLSHLPYPLICSFSDQVFLGVIVGSVLGLLCDLLVLLYTHSFPRFRVFEAYEVFSSQRFH
jgi:hypothetical protein